MNLFLWSNNCYIFGNDFMTKSKYYPGAGLLSFQDQMSSVWYIYMLIHLLFNYSNQAQWRLDKCQPSFWMSLSEWSLQWWILTCCVPSWEISATCWLSPDWVTVATCAEITSSPSTPVTYVIWEPLSTSSPWPIWWKKAEEYYTYWKYK